MNKLLSSAIQNSTWISWTWINYIMACKHGWPLSKHGKQQFVSIFMF